MVPAKLIRPDSVVGSIHPPQSYIHLGCTELPRPGRTLADCPSDPGYQGLPAAVLSNVSSSLQWGIKLCVVSFTLRLNPQDTELLSPFRLSLEGCTLEMSSELILVRDRSNEILRRAWLTFPEVTGVNGFLGAHVVDQLVKKGYRVRGYAISRVDNL